ncbi:MAG: hypothetical protein U0174_25970 [Polyangiaceae bacterium]
MGIASASPAPPKDAGAVADVDAMRVAATSLPDAAPDPASSAPPLQGRYIGRGVWGVHNTGNLRIRIRDGGCDATYNAEGSYFCTTKHRLACALSADGTTASVAETSCVQKCSRHETTLSPCYAEAFGIHGKLGRDEHGSVAFFLDERVVKARSQSKVTFIEMGDDTGPWR